MPYGSFDMGMRMFIDGSLSEEPALNCLPLVTKRTPEVAAVVEFVGSLRNIGLIDVFDWASSRGDVHFAGRGFSRAAFAARSTQTAASKPGLDCTHTCFSPLYKEPLLIRIRAQIERPVRGAPT